MKVKVSRKAHFNAAHRLRNADWSDELNAAIFGKCSNPNYHGHNYELIVSITGEINPDTGYVIDMKLLKELIYNYVETPFDHKNLNLEVPEFSTVNPTVENIVVVIWERLRPHLKDDMELEVILYETPRNFATYKGEE